MFEFENGATYRLVCRADKSKRSLNVYGTTPKSLANVCLYETKATDICQKWIYREVGGHKYFVCKGNTGLALDLLTDSSAGSNVNNYNAHVYAPSDTSYVTIMDASDGNSWYIRIRLASNSSKYLTANQGSNGTAAGEDVNAAGNVYWYKGGLTDFSQDWEPILLEDVSQPDPDPTNGQKLIFPVNNSKITAGYRVPVYLTLNVGEHYGMDMIDNDRNYVGEIIDNNIIASGSGLIYRSGLDDNTGYFACIVYPNALVMENGRRIKKDITVRYWHMHKLSIPTVSNYNNPVKISKNEVIGTMGMKGVATGVHLHVECDTDTTPQYTFFTPTHFKEPDIIKNGTDTTICPGMVFQVGPNQTVNIGKTDIGSWVLANDYQYIGGYTGI